MICTTLNRIRAHAPCNGGWHKLLAGLGKTQADDNPLPYARIVEICGFDDALWACRAEPQHTREWRSFAVWCARQSLQYTGDWRAVSAVNIAERYAHGMATEAAADAAAEAAWAAWGAARAAEAAGAAAEAAWAAWVARDAAEAAWAAWAAARAARAASSAAAREAAWAAQTERFLDVVGRAALNEPEETNVD